MTSEHGTDEHNDDEPDETRPAQVDDNDMNVLMRQRIGVRPSSAAIAERLFGAHRDA